MVYSITGINAGTGPAGQVPSRRELDEWWFSEDVVDINQKSLYILGLLKFMEGTDQLSYFGVSGIHGQPIEKWGDAGNEFLESRSNPNYSGHDSGYCVHAAPLFATWHRPYLLLFEQRIYECMLEVIKSNFSSSPDQQSLLDAAAKWRLPYWDWAVLRPDWTNPNWKKDDKIMLNYPYAFTLEKVQVRTATGTTTVDNPLFTFKVPGWNQGKNFGSYNVGNGWERTIKTVKWPNTRLSFEKAYNNPGTQTLSTITRNLQGHPGLPNTLPECVYRSLAPTYLKDFNQFNTTYMNQGAFSYLSLENIHNNLHGWIGGNGHMSDPSVSAFDPIFWLHHCNIDRIAAIRQALFPDQYVFDPQGKGISRPDGPLQPFQMNSQGTLWTSNACRSLTPLHYAYPELQYWKSVYNPDGKFDQALYQEDIRTLMAQKYSRTDKLTLEQQENQEIAEKVLPVLSRQSAFLPMQFWDKPEALPESFVPDPRAQHEIIKEPVPQAKWESKDYICNVLYDRFALGGDPYTVLIVLGDLPQGPTYDFSDNPTMIGAVYNFATRPDQLGVDENGCGNCKRQIEEEEVAGGQVLLTSHLIAQKERGDGSSLQSLDPQEVGTYLRENLKWMVIDRSNEVIPTESVRGLKVSVAVGDAQYTSEPSEFPTYSDYQVMYEVTDQRPGGANQGDYVL